MKKTMITDIRPCENTMIPPHNCPVVLTAPAHSSVWEGSPWKAFQMMAQGK